MAVRVPPGGIWGGCLALLPTNRASGSPNGCRARRLSSWGERSGRGASGPYILTLRRGGRAVEGGALEKRRVERLRGFESHPLRRPNLPPSVMPPCPTASTTTAIRVRRRPCRPVCAVAAATLAGSRRASDRSSTSACERPRIPRTPGIRPCRRSAARALSVPPTADPAGPSGGIVTTASVHAALSASTERLTVRAASTHTPRTSRTSGL